MKNIIRDWRTYCRDPSQFNHLHFTNLFSDLEKDEIETVFECFPEKEELNKRLGFYQNVGSIRETGDDLVIEGMKYVIALKKQLELIGEQKVAKSLKTDVEVSHEPVEHSDLEIEILETIGDHIIDILAEKESHYFGIFEALYGVTHNNQIKWAIGEPLLPFELGGMNILKIFDYDKSISIDDDGRVWIH